MISQILYSNDKSSVRLLPRNHKVWHSKKHDAVSEQFPISKILWHFSKYMESVALKVRHFTHKYSSEFYFKSYMIKQYRRIPFSIYINFNYIQATNDSGFNYIIRSTDYDSLKPYVSDIIEEYMSHLDNFLSLLKDKWEELKDSKGILLSKEYDRKVIDIFETMLLQEYKLSKEVAITDLSVTCDIHFSNTKEKNLFFDTISKIRKENYKIMVVEDETIFFYPFNKNIQRINREIPKIRFYDKQKDILYRYYKEKSPLILSTLDDQDKTIFEVIDWYSAKEDKSAFEQDFNDAMIFLKDTIRFEVEFTKNSVKPEFNTRNFYDINLCNLSLLHKYLTQILDVESVSFKDLVFSDMVTKERQYVYYDKLVIGRLESTGELTEKFNFVVKNAEFLNHATYNFSVKLPGSKDRKINLYNETSPNAYFSKIKRFKEQGVIRGFGKNLVLNEPYRSLLHIYNVYHSYNLLTQQIAHRLLSAGLSVGEAEASQAGPASLR